jgi:hypothetical protein
MQSVLYFEFSPLYSHKEEENEFPASEVIAASASQCIFSNASIK